MGGYGNVSTRVLGVLLIPLLIALVAVVGVWAGLYLSRFLSKIYALPLAALFSMLGLAASVFLSRALLNRVTSKNRGENS